VPDVVDDTVSRPQGKERTSQQDRNKRIGEQLCWASVSPGMICLHTFNEYGDFAGFTSCRLNVLLFATPPPIVSWS
jgi:hypothetical protein